LIALKGVVEKQVAEKQVIHQNHLTEGKFG
jgi:hypothetical protein